MAAADAEEALLAPRATPPPHPTPAAHLLPCGRGARGPLLYTETLKE